MVSISPNDPAQSLESREDFTPQSASKLIPLIESIVREMSELSTDLDRHRAQLIGLDEIHQTIDGDAYEDEVADVRRSFIEVEEKFNSCHRELLALGVATHEPFDGSVDFPARLNRRRINLCWHPGEETVSHWHEVTEDGANRRSVDTSMVPGAAV
jgi:hypothetical protein